jgi:two-component system, OmpR family, response regulator
MIEDDVEIASLLKRFLDKNDMTLRNYTSPLAGIDALQTENFDLLLLDLSLPDMDGQDVCKSIRTFSNIPIIISSARGDIDDKLEALHFGADDYLPKPYDPRELIARIQRVMKRSMTQDKSRFHVDSITQKAYKYGTELDLTRAEFEIFSLLYKKEAEVVSRDTMTQSSQSIQGSERSVDVIITRLRQKLSEDDAVNYIHSVRGVGYIFRDDNA